MLDTRDKEGPPRSDAKPLNARGVIPNFTFIVTHAEPLVPSRFFDQIIALGNYGSELSTHIGSLDPFWHEARPVAFQVAGSYALPNAINHVGFIPDVVGIISFRKIISRSRIGLIAPNAPHMQQVTSNELSLFERSEFWPSVGHEFFVAQPLYFQEGLIAQYASCHEAKDLFDYMGLAVDVGVLSQADLNDFTRQKHLIPGGCELGYFPWSWLLPTLEKLERVGRAFLRNNRARISKYDDYQIRALSFLSERLGSFLLLQRLTQTYGATIHKSVSATCALSSKLANTRMA